MRFVRKFRFRVGPGTCLFTREALVVANTTDPLFHPTTSHSQNIGADPQRPDLFKAEINSLLSECLSWATRQRENRFALSSATFRLLQSKSASNAARQRTISNFTLKSVKFLAQPFHSGAREPFHDVSAPVPSSGTGETRIILVKVILLLNLEEKLVVAAQKCKCCECAAGLLRKRYNIQYNFTNINIKEPRY